MIEVITADSNERLNVAVNVFLAEHPGYKLIEMRPEVETVTENGKEVSRLAWKAYLYKQ